jgi:protein-tyrosine phosphatase
MRRLVADVGLQGSIELDSAGMGSWHMGQPPDTRATEAALRRGIVLEGSARQVSAEDFKRFDLILAMDRSNERALSELAPDDRSRAKIRLLREFDPASSAAGRDDLDVPDPYYEGQHGFEVVLDQVQAACAGLLEQVRESAERTSEQATERA